MRPPLRERVFLYAGLVALLAYWPAAQIVLRNESFMVIGNWSLAAYGILTLAFFALPVAVLAITHGFAERFGASSDALAWVTALVVGTVLWLQIYAYYVTPALWQMYLTGRAVRYGVLVSGLLVAAWALIRLRRYLHLALQYLSILGLAAAVLLLWGTLTLPGVSRTPSGSLSPAQVSAENKAVYLIIFDGLSLPALMVGDQIDARMFPNFARIAREWTWFRMATTNANATLLVRPMIFSGRYLRYRHRTDDAAFQTDNLFMRLRPRLRVHSFAPGIGLCRSASDVCWEAAEFEGGFAGGIRLTKAVIVAYLETILPPAVRGRVIARTFLADWRFDWRGPVPPTFRGQANLYYADAYKRQFEEFQIAAIRPQARGGFYLLWSFLSHFPYVLTEQGELAESPYQWFEPGDAEKTARTLANYRRQLQYVDRLLGTFVDRIKTSGLYEDAIIVLSSDHGVESDPAMLDPMTSPARRRWVTREVAAVPLFVKAPGLRPGPTDVDAQSVDITPTILDALGMPWRREQGGYSLLGEIPPDRRKLFLQGGDEPFLTLRRDGTWIPPAP